uniref:Uncharacterized protein n=1 Tax=Magallana gigas TaxID=29159 RepID=A0A8W8P2X3_MAGGI
MTGYNLAYKKPTWQTLDKYSSDKAVDGLYTNLSAIGNQCAVSFASSEVTWLVDLETINSISKIVLYHVTEGSTLGCPIVQSRFQNEACRLMCLEMCRKDLENLSYKKRTWQSATYSSSGTSEKAVDGRHTSRHYSSGQCAISKPSTQITWWVNLGKIYMIDHVVIYFRTDNVQWGCPVVEVPQCSKPCPSNCEECYPDTGICMKCKLGFEGYACERACQAVTDVKVSLPVTIAGSAYEALFSSKGLSFPEHGYHNMSLFLSLSEQSTNLVNVSFTIHGASVVSVYLLDEIGSLISMVSIHNI